MAKVTFDFVAKIMKREKRNIYYLKDNQGKVLDYNDDDSVNVDSAIEQLQDTINNVTAGTLTVELPKAKKGAGNNGGDTTLTKLVYTIAVGGAENNTAGAMMQGGNNFMFSLLMQTMQTNQNLQMQLIQQKYENDIADLKKEMNEKKGKSKADLVEVFADKLGDKFLEAERLKKAAKKASEAMPLAKNTEAATAPINSNENSPEGAKKDKIKNSLSKFRSIDTEYIDNLDFLADYAAKNPEAYKLFIQSLKNGDNE